ncbi:hypothetical protein LguiA_029080 [Lonicera macranthoides]
MEKSTASSSSPILPEEIIFQILKELPVKTLVRFRAVSKLWCSIIDDPFFVDSHRTRSHTRNGGISILCQYRENFSFKIYTTDPQGRSPSPCLTLPDGILGDVDDNYLDIDSYSFNRLQSVNGLVCRNNCTWNPTTRQSIDLPPISIDANEDRWMVFPNNLLGFDSVTKQYKVFHICHSFFRQLTRVEFRILTLGRDLNWRNLDSVPEKLGLRTGFGVCCVDDVIFCSGSADSNEVIVAFEVGSEKFKVIPLPIGAESADASCLNSHIIQVGGRLGFIKWRDKLYGNKWSILTKPMGSIHTSEILLCSKGKNQNRDSIYSCSYYDPESKSLRMVPKVTEFLKDYQRPEDFVGFTKHVECLIRLKVT